MASLPIPCRSRSSEDARGLKSIEVLREARHQIGELREEDTAHVGGIQQVRIKMRVARVRVRRHHEQREVALVKSLWHYGGAEIFAGAQLHVTDHAPALRSNCLASVLPFAGLELLVDHEATCPGLEMNRVLLKFRLRVGIVFED